MNSFQTSIFRIILFIFLLFTTITSCKDEFSLFETEIELLSDWDEAVAIYANINLTGGKNYIRVNRGFLVDNFFVANTNMDSIYFDPSQVEVNLYKLRVYDLDINGIISADTLRMYRCRDTLIDKDSTGNFSTEKVQLFYTETKGFKVNNAEDLYVGIEVVTPNNVVKSHTKIVETSRFIKPNQFGLPFEFENTTFDLQIYQPKYSQLYKSTATCSYKEIIRIDGQIDTIIKSFTFFVGVHRESTMIVDDEESHLWRDSTSLFHISLEEDILENGDTVNTIKRLLNDVYFSGYAGNADLALVTSISPSGTGFNVEPTNYSNVQNGYGYCSAYARFNSIRFEYSYGTKATVKELFGDKYFFGID